MPLKLLRKLGFSRSGKSLFWATFATFALIRCETEVAGTSVGTGNPTEIEVSFSDDSGAVPLTGSMEIYAATQIPIPGFAPAPLISLPITASPIANLKAQAFVALDDSLWDKGSIEGGVYRFHVVIQGQKQGSIMSGLAFRKKEGDFVLRAKDANAIRRGSVATIGESVYPLVTYQGELATNNLSPSWDYYLFLYGTGYYSKANQGKFSLPNLPLGSFQSHVILLPSKNHISGSIDSTTIFGLTTSIGPAMEKIALSKDITIIPLPDSLKKK